MNAELNSLIDAVRVAAAQGRTLRLRGGGTKDFWGQSLTGEVLDTRAYRGIVSYEPSELVVTARCGTPLAELEAALAEKGQCLAFEPPHFGQASANGATVGGMVAAGLSGPARATAGAVRDFVLGARFINGLGEHLTFGGQVMKNVAGYDVSRLMAGSWGTLGLITEVSLKVLPVAPAEATLMVAGLAQGPSLDLLHRWGGQPLPLNASAWMRDTTAQPVTDVLMVRLRGAVAAVQSALGKMSDDAVALGAQVQAMDNTEAANNWRACTEQSLAFFDAPSPDVCLWRLSVPQTAPVFDLPYATCIEWQGAQRWLWAPAWAASSIRSAAQTAGGHATLFRASAGSVMAREARQSAPVMASEARQAIFDASATQQPSTDDRSVGVNTPLAPVQQRIQQQLQKQFDPKGVFATGRMHPL